MTNIHKTALVDEKARLAENVEIGPFSIIGPDVTIGAGTKIGAYVQIKNCVEIGNENQIFHGSSIGELGQDLTFSNPEPKIVIGNKNILRENVVIHQPAKQGNTTRLGDQNYIMCNVHLGHDVRMGNNNIIAPTSALGGHVELENNVYISGLVAIHQFVHIGRYAIIGGGTPALLDVPPYSMLTGSPGAITGLNMVAMRRAKFSSDKIQLVKNIYKAVFMRNAIPAKAPDILEGEMLIKYQPGSEEYLLIKHYIDFLRASKRGITPRQT
ncbi:MAG: acyl-ACP--UDP-N-acetylglucosamine O-acyltransferase [Spirochaetia bacterium]|nr:acyl-ACP--UDP-N-acetylglucosamine O-acyltransferase [Spirochaetia bacterium]